MTTTDELLGWGVLPDEAYTVSEAPPPCRCGRVVGPLNGGRSPRPTCAGCGFVPEQCPCAVEADA